MNVGTVIEARSNPHGPGESEVVVEPAVDAGPQPLPEVGGEPVAVLVGEQGAVDVGQQGRQRRHDARPVGVAEAGRFLVEIGAQGGLTLEGRAELLHVLLTHAREEVQALGLPRSHAGDHESAGDPVGEQRGRRQRMRPTARGSRGDAALDSEVVEDLLHVRHHVGDGPSRPPRGGAVPGPRIRHQPQADPFGLGPHRGQWHQRSRRAVVEEQDGPVASRVVDVEGASVGQVDGGHGRNLGQNDAWVR